MPENYIDAGALDPDGGDYQAACKRACLDLNASVWYAVWNSYGEANYVEETDSRCRCSDFDPEEGKLSSQLIEDPGYNTYSLAGPHVGFRPLHKLDAYDLDDDECIRHCAVMSPGSTWVAVWSIIGEVEGGVEPKGTFASKKRCICEDTSKPYGIVSDPLYELVSLRGPCMNDDD
jgi:hypothetical protein